MSILGINPEAIPDRNPVPAGTYPVRITSLKSRDETGEPIVSSTGRKMIKGSLEVLDRDDAEPIFFQLLEVKKGDNPIFVRSQGEFTKGFLLAFDLPLDIDEDSLVEAAPGLEGWASVKMESDPEYGDRNVVSRFLKQRGGK